MFYGTEILTNDFSNCRYFKYLDEFLQYAISWTWSISRFLDDWEMKNKIFALHCIDHILDNVSKKDLHRFGYEVVLKSALFHVLNFRELEVPISTINLEINFQIRASFF